MLSRGNCNQGFLQHRSLQRVTIAGFLDSYNICLQRVTIAGVLDSYMFTARNVSKCSGLLQRKTIAGVLDFYNTDIYSDENVNTL